MNRKTSALALTIATLAFGAASADWEKPSGWYSKSTDYFWLGQGTSGSWSSAANWTDTYGGGCNENFLQGSRSDADDLPQIP